MMNAKELLRQTESLLLQNDHITLAEASATQLHNALSTAAMNALTPTWVKCEAKPVLPWAAGRREGTAGGKRR